MTLIYFSFFVEYLLFKVIVLLAIVLIIKIKKLDRKFNSRQIKVFYFFVFLYPLVELSFKVLTQSWASNHEMIQYQIYINILEHLLAGMAVGVFLFPIIVETLQKLSNTEKFLFFVSIVALFCLLYEIVGFYFFYFPNDFTGINMYTDTMRDLSMNIIGAILIFTIIKSD
jgi:hypothetical protein